MSATAISAFREPVRVLIGDDDPEVPEYTNAMIDAATRLVFQMGQAPTDNRTYTLGTDGQTISPGIVWGDDFGVVALKAARIRLGGSEGGITFRTRALTVGRADRGDNKWRLMQELENRLYDKEGQVAFATQRDFVQWLNDMSGGILEKNLVWNGLNLNFYPY